MRERRVDVADDTFILADPRRVRDRLDDEAWCDQVWPHLTRRVQRDRGPKGVRWTVTGQVVGEMEVWIEPYWEGAVVHHYLRGTAGRRAPRDVAARHTRRWKRAVHGLKDCLEGNTL
jgi:hypothetical protein